MTADYMALGLILCAALCLFWTQKLRMDVTALLVMVTLIVPWPHPGGAWRGILTYQEGFSGFGSVAVVMVVAMFVFSVALVRTGAGELLGLRLFQLCAGHELRLQLAVLTVCTLASMFVNDTTVVLVFMPLIVQVCKERNLSPSRYLLLAAYGALLGGQWTLVGTRSNIIISDFLRQRTGTGLGFFDFSPVAAVVFLVCAVAFVLWGRKRMPEAAATPEETLGRQYLTEVLVTPRSSTVGKRLDALPWARQTDLSVVELIRDGERMPARGWLSLQAGDVLIMQGSVPTIGQLLKSADFQLKQEVNIDNKTLHSVDLVTVEALLAPHSDYIGKTLEEMDFRREYGFTVMGISRHGTTIADRPLATPLEFGDSLLLLGHVASLDRLAGNPQLIVLGHKPFPVVRRIQAIIPLLLLAAVVTTSIAGWLTPAISIPMAALLVILFGLVRVEDAYRAVDWQAVITAAAMIPFGLAVDKTGAAAKLADLIVGNLQGWGALPVLGVVLALAMVLTHFLDNSAAAIIIAPLAFEMAQELGVSPQPFMVGLAVCISASFAIPIAHESTILVMGPGRYEFKHYFRVGGVFAVLTWLVATALTPVAWPF